MSKPRTWPDVGIDMERLNVAIDAAEKPKGKPSPPTSGYVQICALLPREMVRKMKVDAIDRGITFRVLLETTLRKGGYDL